VCDILFGQLCFCSEIFLALKKIKFGLSKHIIFLTTPLNSPIFYVFNIFFLISDTQLKNVGKCTNDPQKYPCLHDDFSFGTVCASNGRTYTKAREVRCLKESNPALEVLHEGACSVQEVEKIIGLDDVCKMAMHTFESNPLCGSDNVTYSNAYTFLCAAKSSPKDKSKTLLAQYFFTVQ